MALSSVEAPAISGSVVVVEELWGAAFDRLAEKVHVVREPGAWADPSRLRQLVAGASAVVVRNRTMVDEALFDAAPALLIVGRAGVGLDNIDLPAADARGIVVSAALGANARSVAELAVGLAFALARDIAGHDRRTRAGEWERRLGRELYGLCWGAVGLGATGRATVTLAKGIGMTSAGYDPYLPDEARVPGLDRRAGSLQELLAAADVVSLHLPLDESTSGLVDAAFLAAMRPGAVLVNVARGGLVDESALAAALRDGTLGGAALDVRSEEPPRLGELERSDRVLLTPHVAGLTITSQERVTEMLAEDLLAVLAGEQASYAVGAARRARHPAS